VNFLIEDRFEATVAELEALLDDPAFPAELARAMPAVQAIEPLERRDDGERVHKRVQYTPNTDGKIPAFGRSVIKPSMLRWIEESTFHKAQHRYEYRILPNLPEAWRDRFDSHGSYQLVQAGAQVERRIEGEVVVRVPLLGRTVEKLLVREVTDNFRAEAACVRALLQARRAVS
jgi:hypothetical protein